MVLVRKNKVKKMSGWPIFENFRKPIRAGLPIKQ